MGILQKELLPHYTYEDYKQWEGRWELIEGIPYAMIPLPRPKHQRISNKIATQLELLLENCPKCVALLPVDWKVAEDIVIQPDNLVVCSERIEKIFEKPYLDIPPTLIFEIISQATEKKDRYIKPKIYAKEAVKYYVLINPETEEVEVYELEKNNFKLKSKFKRDGKFSFDLSYCVINFNFTQIFL